MEYKIFLISIILALLSVIFFIFSFVILELRSRLHIRLNPLMWAAFFFIAIIPFICQTHIMNFKLYTDYTGGVRVEIHKSEDESVLNEFYVEKKAGEAVYTVCVVYAAVRIIKSAASAYMGMASYFNMLHFLTKHSSVCNDERILKIFETAKKKAGVRRNINLRIMKPNVRISPCTCGINFPTVFIGRDYLSEYSDLWLELVFLHELIHIKHHDSLIKIISLLSSSLQFSIFNKRVKKALNEDAEYLCDDEIIKIMGKSVIGDYMNMLLDAAGRNIESVFKTETASPVSPGAGFIIRRYNNLTNKKSSNPDFIIYLTLCFAILFNIVLFSFFTFVNINNLGIDTASPFMEHALCQYFGLSDHDDLSEEHLSKIYSIEFALSDSRELLGNAADEKYVLSCIFNEGFVYDGNKYLSPSNDDNSLRFVYDALPFIIREDMLSTRLNNSTELYGMYSTLNDSGVNLKLLKADYTVCRAYLINEYENGNLKEFMLNSKIVDSRDLVLFKDLRTLIFSDSLKPSSEDLLTEAYYAVISRK